MQLFAIKPFNFGLIISENLIVRWYTRSSAIHSIKSNRQHECPSDMIFEKVENER